MPFNGANSRVFPEVCGSWIWKPDNGDILPGILCRLRARVSKSIFSGTAVCELRGRPEGALGRSSTAATVGSSRRTARSRMRPQPCGTRVESDAHRLLRALRFSRSPTAQVFPFAVETHWPAEIAGRQMETYHEWMKCVVPATMAGGPALAAPAGFGDNGLPMGKSAGRAHWADFAQGYNGPPSFFRLSERIRILAAPMPGADDHG